MPKAENRDQEKQELKTKLADVQKRLSEKEEIFNQGIDDDRAFVQMNRDMNNLRHLRETLESRLREILPAYKKIVHQKSKSEEDSELA